MYRLLLQAPGIPTSCTTEATVGVGGSAGTCTRQFGVSIFFFELPAVAYGWTAGWQVAAATKLQSTISVAKEGGIDVVLHGLGLRTSSVSTLSSTDHFVGINDTTAGTQLLSSSYIPDGASAGSVAHIDVSAYVRTLVTSALATGIDPSGRFVTLRLSGRSLLGCDTHCDDACPIRRYTFRVEQVQDVTHTPWNRTGRRD